MFNIYRMLFLVLKRVRIVKITPPHISTIRQPPPVKFPIPLTGRNSLHPLTLFGKPCIVILDFPFQLPCQTKFSGFVLLSKILLTNHNARFLKVQYFMKELKHKVNFLMYIDIHRNDQLGLV